MNEPEDFREAIERAQRVSGDLGNIFGGAGRVAFEARPDAAGPDLEYDAKVAVFNLPADAEEYEEVLNLCLRGQAVKNWEDRTFNKEGDFLVAICYLVPRPRPQRAANDQDAGDAERLPRPQRVP